MNIEEVKNFQISLRSLMTDDISVHYEYRGSKDLSNFPEAFDDRGIRNLST